MRHEPNFTWPERFSPGEARLHVSNARDMAATVESVWSHLVAAPLWTSWFPSATGVKLPGGSDRLASGMRFTWSQAGVRLDAQVREFVACRRIAWLATSPWIQAYHTWDLAPSARGCSVVTDETQRGLMPLLFGWVLEPRMTSLHDTWLTRLETRARPIAGD